MRFVIGCLRLVVCRFLVCVCCFVCGAVVRCVVLLCVNGCVVVVACRCSLFVVCSLLCVV